MEIRTLDLMELVNYAKDHKAMRSTAMVSGHTGSNVENISFTDALERAQFGDQTLVERAESMVNDFALEIETPGREWQPTVAGAYPVVPEYCAGIPDCMRGMVYSSSESMPVKVVVDLFASCGFTGKQLVDRGTVVLALVLLLQRFRNVELAVLTSSKDRDDNPVGLLIPVSSKPLNISLAAFLFRPVFFRFLTASYMDLAMHVPSSIPAPTGIDHRKELGLSANDIFIEPAVGHPQQTNEILGNPKAWLQKQLDRFQERQ
jgi:hypothetical protein